MVRGQQSHRTGTVFSFEPGVREPTTIKKGAVSSQSIPLGRFTIVIEQFRDASAKLSIKDRLGGIAPIDEVTVLGGPQEILQRVTEARDFIESQASVSDLREQNRNTPEETVSRTRLHTSGISSAEDRTLRGRRTARRLNELEASKQRLEGFLESNPDVAKKMEEIRARLEKESRASQEVFSTHTPISSRDPFEFESSRAAARRKERKQFNERRAGEAFLESKKSEAQLKEERQARINEILSRRRK